MEIIKHPFPPSVDKSCTSLILGSMPSVKSLGESEYYAHPRNVFWNIMGELFHFNRDTTPYSQRLEILRKNKIALWDSLASCVRKGSLDSKICSETPNDFKNFLKKFHLISNIYFNGQSAYKFFKKYHPEICQSHINIAVMPSTSPANAMLKYEEKLEKWTTILAS